MKRLTVTVIIFILIISSAIGSSLYIKEVSSELEGFIESSISNSENKEELEKNISAAIEEYRRSLPVFMMFAEKDLCRDLLSELKTAEFNINKSEEKLSEALNKSKIALEQIKNSLTVNIKEII